MDISARAISLTDRPQRAIWVTSVRMRREDRTSISSHPLADLAGNWTSCKCSRDLKLCFKNATVSQYAPGNAGQLVGERDRKHVAVQSLLGCLDPGLESMTLPALRLDQHDPRGL